MTSTFLRAALVTACLVAPSATVAQPAPSRTSQPSIDPRAEKVLRDMATYLSRLESFQVQSEATDEIVLTNGSKVQQITTSLVSIHRPNKLRSEQIGPGAQMTAWYDGKNLGLYCKSSNTYGVVSAPPTIDETLDVARKKYGVDAPAADLIYSQPYEALTEHARSGQYLDVESVDGVPAHHLAFQQDDVDWQIWVKQGPQPLPVRYVITTKSMADQPEFTARLTNWKTDVSLPATAFGIQPPAGAKRVAKLPSTCPQAG